MRGRKEPEVLQYADFAQAIGKRGLWDGCVDFSFVLKELQLAGVTVRLQITSDHMMSELNSQVAGVMEAGVCYLLFLAIA